MKLDIKLDSHAILTFGRIQLNFTWLYKKVQNKLSENLKKISFIG